jgi:hypothetical protein
MRRRRRRRRKKERKKKRTSVVARDLVTDDCEVLNGSVGFEQWP